MDNQLTKHCTSHTALLFVASGYCACVHYHFTTPHSASCKLLYSISVISTLHMYITPPLPHTDEEMAD
jgi:hypothetical protein